MDGWMEIWWKYGNLSSDKKYIHYLNAPEQISVRIYRISTNRSIAIFYVIYICLIFPQSHLKIHFNIVIENIEKGLFLSVMAELGHWVNDVRQNWKYVNVNFASDETATIIMDQIH